jgi:NADPH:quinone reductase-like Zn-dependent oxidoreductase
MKAIVYESYGPLEVLQVKEIEKPEPKNNELLIKVHAAEATKADCEMRGFHFQIQWLWLPMRLVLGVFRPKRQILGGYFAGEVESVGRDVSKFKKGDKVFGATRLRLGAYGEYLVLPDTFTLAPLPDHVSFEEAAAVPMGGLNALHFIRAAKIQKGERVLINGSGGSIGVYAIQITKSMGGEVTAVDSAIKKDMLSRIGADHFIDYAKEDFTQTGQTWDVIFSMIAKMSYSGCLAALNPKGRYLMANPRLSDMIRAFLWPRVKDKTVFFTFAGEKEEELLTLKKMIEEGQIKPVVDGIYSFEHVQNAHQRAETEQRLGPVVLSFEPAGAF